MARAGAGRVPGSIRPALGRRDPGWVHLPARAAHLVQLTGFRRLMTLCLRSGRIAVRAWLAPAVLTVLAAGTSQATADAAPGAPRELTLTAAIDIALSGNPQLAIERENIVAADARAASDATLRLPLVAVKANVFLWDRAIVANLGPDIGNVTIRDRVTGTVDLQVSQPISGALAIGTLVERDRALAQASRAQRDGRRVEIAYQTAEAYLAALQARTLGQVAEATLQQLDADLQHARVLLQGGTLQKVDVLRLEVERARVEQQRLQAETAAIAARRRLGLLLGLPDGSKLALVDVDTTPPAMPWTEDEVVARARRDRAEVRAAEASSSAAELGTSIARANYYPTVSVVGIYSHAVNAGLLGAADSKYIGLSVDWNLWDWGKRGADVDASRAASRQAHLAQAALGEQIAVDARTRWQAARLALATIEVADRGLAAAVEAQRLQAARFAQGAATTIELLDAETALANAKAQAAIGRYQYLVAWMAVSREIGSLPVHAEAHR
ncbi:MAG: TolC family protein [Deltaproteobacteria bacterium]|nr:MAG: TolC family protein [Deltaproteobacteria bacterium]